MTDFLERLVGRTQGRLPVVQPLLPSRHAPDAAYPARAEPFALEADGWPGEVLADTDGDGEREMDTIAPRDPRARRTTAAMESGAGDAARILDARGSREAQPALKPIGPASVPARGAIGQDAAPIGITTMSTVADGAAERGNAMPGNLTAASGADAGTERPPAAPGAPGAAQSPRQAQASAEVTAIPPRLAMTRPASSPPSVRPASPVRQAAADLAQMRAALPPRVGERPVAPQSPWVREEGGARPTPGDTLEQDLLTETADERSTAPDRERPLTAPPYQPASIREGASVSVPPMPRRDDAIAPRTGTGAPSVRVTIGRIEVRAVQQATPVPPPSSSPQPELALSLDAYLKQRSNGGA